MLTEADTCRTYVTPLLQKAGWDSVPHQINEQRSFTDGRVLFVSGRPKRGKQKRADYILRHSPDYQIAVVEAKSSYKRAADGVEQAKEYALILGLKFAYATNGQEIIEIDLFTGKETLRSEFPTPDELWQRQRKGLGLADEQVAQQVLTPGRPDPSKPLRYYQEIAINEAVRAVISGNPRALLTLCTGSGKTLHDLTAVPFETIAALHTTDPFAGRRTPRLPMADRAGVCIDSSEHPPAEEGICKAPLSVRGRSC